MGRFIVIIICLISCASRLTAQEDENQEPLQGWKDEAKIQLLFNQSAYNKEWTGGEISNVAGNITLDYILNYRKGDFTWDNKLLVNYGITKEKGDDFLTKTSDRFEFNSIAGKQLKNSEWYLSFFANLKTQMTKGYDYSEDPVTGEAIRTEKTDFFSPGYLQAGPGIMWKKNEDLYVNIAPATGRLIFVNSSFTNAPDYVDGSYYGVDRGKSSRFEFGASVTAYGKFEIFENVSMKNSLSLYSNYLESPGNIDIDYLMNLEMSINKFLSANLIFQTIYDDNAVGAFQVREVFGLGFNVAF